MNDLPNNQLPETTVTVDGKPVEGTLAHTLSEPAEMLSQCFSQCLKVRENYPSTLAEKISWRWFKARTWFKENVFYNMPRWFRITCYRIGEWWHRNVTCRINPRNKWVTQAVGREWMDKTHAIPEFLFAAIIHFVEGEKCFEHINYDSDAGHAEFSKNLKECYIWAKTGRHEYQEIIHKSFPPNESAIAYLGLTFGDEPFPAHNKDGSPIWSEEQVSAAYDRVYELEEKYEAIETRWLVWIITSRGYL